MPPLIYAALAVLAAGAAAWALHLTTTRRYPPQALAPVVEWARNNNRPAPLPSRAQVFMQGVSDLMTNPLIPVQRISVTAPAPAITSGLPATPISTPSPPRSPFAPQILTGDARITIPGDRDDPIVWSSPNPGISPVQPGDMATSMQVTGTDGRINAGPVGEPVFQPHFNG